MHIIFPIWMPTSVETRTPSHFILSRDHRDQEKRVTYDLLWNAKTSIFKML